MSKLYYVYENSKTSGMTDGPCPRLVRATSFKEASDIAETVIRENGGWGGPKGELELLVYRLTEPEGNIGYIYEPVQTPKKFKYPKVRA